MSNFIVRTANISDAAYLSDIYGYYVENTAVSYEYKAPDKAEFERRISNTLEKYPYIVAQDESGVLGYAYASPFNVRAAAEWTAEVSIYVSREHRGRGIGKALYTRLEKILSAQNYQSLVAKVAYREREDEYLSHDSVKFHISRGYSAVGVVEHCGYKFGHWYGLMLMEKHIGTHAVPAPEIIPFPDVKI